MKKRPLPSDPVLAQLKAGAITATAACVRLADMGLLNPATGTLQNDTPEGRRVLKTFSEFHRSWFGNNSFLYSLPVGECKAATTNVYESTEPALHITRAVLNPAAKYSDIVTLPNSLQSIRVNQNLTDGPVYQGAPVTGYTYDSTDAIFDNLLWTPTVANGGELLGVGPIRELKAPFLKTFHPDALRVPAALRANVDVLKSQGAGLLGSNAYIMLNAGREYSQVLDGGKALMRRWSKVVLQDVLCRDLPVVRLTDAKANSASSISFRQGQTCMQCHSTMDPMAGVVRHLHLSWVGSKCTGRTDIVGLVGTPISEPAETAVPDADPLFSKRPRTGKFFFRSYNGDLLDIPVNGLPELGTQLSLTRDLYACAAKRYYNFFTGISVSLQDAGDPQLPTMSEDDLKHRNFVIQLAESLRNDPEQKVLKLLPKIFESAVYQSDNYLRGSQP